MVLFFKSNVSMGALILALLISACQGKYSLNEDDTSTLGRDTVEVRRLINLSKKSLFTNLELGINQAIQASKIAENTSNHAITFDAYKTVAKAALDAGNFKVVEIYMSKFLNLAEQDHDEKMIGRAYSNLAMFHLYTNEPDQADSLFTLGLSILEQHAKKRHQKISEEDQIIIFLNLGHIYLAKKLYGKAESMYLKGFNLAVNKTPFLYYQGQLTQSLSLFFIQQKQAQKAKRYLDLAHKIQRDSKNEAMIPINLLISGSYFELIGQSDQAKLAYQEGIELAKKIKSIDLIIELSDHLYRIYESRGDHKQALFYLNLSLEQKDLSRKDLARQSLLGKTIERNILKQINSNNQEAKNTQNILLVIPILIVLTISVFFHRKSHWDNEEIKLLNLDKEDKNKLKVELEFAQQKLAKNALEAIQKEESLKQIVEKIKNTQDGNSENLSVLNSLRNDLEKLNKTKNWDEFEKGFVGLHANFFPDLLVAHPKLTNNERRLCAFLKIDLSTKEISKLTGQTIRAIELSRIRLRKKLQLTNSDLSLFQYLSNF